MLVYSLGPVPPGADAFPNADKLMHFSLYTSTVLAFLLAAVWRPGRGEGRFPWAGPWIVGAAIAAGLVVEILQGLYFGRKTEGTDAVADAVGAGLGYAVFVALGRLTAKRR